MAQMDTDEFARLGDEPMARVGSRFLPVPAVLLPPILDPTPGIVDLPVPPGTPVHAMTAGRVTHAEGSSVGEVVVRGEGGVRCHYRRLLPSTVAVSEGQTVEAGSVLGLVATSSDTAALGFGIQFSDGTWDDTAERLVGLADPSELYLLPPVAGDAGLVAELPSQRRPARARAHPEAERTTRGAAPSPEQPPATPSRPATTQPATPQPVTREPAAPTPADPAAAVDPAPAPVAEAPSSEASPTEARSATDRLTRRRPRSGSAPEPTSAASPDPAPPEGPAPAPDPPRGQPDPDSAVAGATVDAEPPPSSTVEQSPAPSPDDTDAEDEDEPSAPDEDKAAAMLVGRRRRPRGTP